MNHNTEIYIKNNKLIMNSVLPNNDDLHDMDTSFVYKWLACADAMQRLCTAAEVKFYGQSLLGGEDGEVKSKYQLRPNPNCNMTGWPEGCEPGWSCNVRKEDKVDMKNDKVIPERLLDCQPCCAGFFCPVGLTCMIRESLSLIYYYLLVQNSDFCIS